MEKNKTFKTFICIIAILLTCIMAGSITCVQKTGKQAKALAYTQTVDGMNQAVISSRLD